MAHERQPEKTCTAAPDTARYPLDRTWPVADAVHLACLLEASAHKVGNVHPQAAFADMHFGHFVSSAHSIRDVFQSVQRKSVGQLVLESTTATQRAVGRNTNLGTILLFAPLAKAASPLTGQSGDLRSRVQRELGSLTADDSQLVYQAIRIANPGGLGKTQQNDVSAPAPDDLLQAMAQVADTDAVARQYASGFADVFDRLLPWLQQELAAGDSAPDQRGGPDGVRPGAQGTCQPNPAEAAAHHHLPLEGLPIPPVFADALARAASPLEAVCRLQLRWLAHEPDGLIVRKVGLSVARQVQQHAASALAQLEHHSGRSGDLQAVKQLDRFLRADGHQRNPGTTADLIAATLLAQLLLG